MHLVKFDISQVDGWPFQATEEARQEYGSHAAHPILDRYFDASALVRHFYWKKLDLIAGLHDNGRDGTALSAGCGPGVELPTLSSGFNKVIALDINQSDLEIARAVCGSADVSNVEFINADLLDPPLAPGSLDTVFLIDVLEHFKDTGAAVDSAHTLLKDDGRLVVAAPTENRCNDALRRIMGYSKPATHYHTSKELERAAGKRFRLLKRVRPFGLPRALSLVDIFLFAK